MSAVDVLEVSMFGDRRTATITKNRANWKVQWRDSPIDSFVPIRMAINARDAAQRAASAIEQSKWGNRVLMAALRGAVENDGAVSTEMAKWINAKAEGRAYDRHELIPAGLVTAYAHAALARCKGETA